MTVVDWDRHDTLIYLGTYFPRSYAETYCILRDFFSRHTNEWKDKECLSVFDFGCGTGGEFFGLIAAIEEFLPQLRSIEVTAFDGNHHALRLFEHVADTYEQYATVNLVRHIFPLVIDDFYDLSMLNSLLVSRFDIILSSKVVCEFVINDQFEQRNAYTSIARFFLSKLESHGMVLFTDISSYSHVSKEWLPHMMDKGLSEAGCHVIARNEGFNQVFTVSHSHRVKDRSKIVWRIIAKPERV